MLKIRQKAVRVSRVVVLAALVSVFANAASQIPAIAKANTRFADQANPDLVGTNSRGRGNVLLAQAAIPPHLRALNQDKVAEAVSIIEDVWEKDFENYFGANFTDQSVTVKDISQAFAKIAAQTGKKPALVYVIPAPEHLELVLVTPSGQAIHKRVKGAKRDAVVEQAKLLRTAITKPSLRRTTRYLPPAQQLYKWMVAPLEADLKAQNIETLLFCLGGGLRTLPVAALHDGRQFFVEKYSSARVPAFKMTDLAYADLRNSQVLAMGTSQFRERNSLPAVPLELSAIAKNLWQGQSFLNQDSTLANLESERASQPYRIIHLATHANFQPGAPNNSYIEFWDSKLTLSQIRQMRWNNPPVDLLVLSACQTAMGDKDAELGFAGMAVQANVKSAIASLWSVSDEGTLGLMTQLYRDLKTAKTKSEALQQAQIAMLKGRVRLQGGQLRSPGGNLPLPPELAELDSKNFSHPYYWAAFTLVGSPW